MSISLRLAKKRLGIDQYRPLRTRADYDFFSSVARSAITAARKAGDDAKAAELSEAKARIKQSFGLKYCVDCGNPINQGERCLICRREYRKRRRLEAKTAPEPKLPEFEPIKEYVRRTIQSYIVDTVRACNGNRALAAKALHISRSALYRRLDGRNADPILDVTPAAIQADRVYQAYLRKILREVWGDRQKAAKLAGISVATFYRHVPGKWEG
jgi:recombinational DNA repair protein RecR